MANYLSYGFISIGLLLSWWFNRSRLFFTLLILTLSQAALTIVPGGDFAFYQQFTIPIICFLLPLNIWVFSLLRERGIFSFWGLLRLGSILAQVIFIFLVLLTHDQDLLPPVNQNFLPDIITGLLPATLLPQPALAAFALAELALLRKLWIQPGRTEQTFFSLLLAIAATLHWQAIPAALPVFFTAATLMILSTIIQDSYAMAYLDELTGLPARRALREELLQLSGHYAIAMLDIDFFKKFNDNYGHDAGDDVLRLAAGVMKEVSGGGKAFRYGGEEFTVIFAGKTLAEAVPHLEELRQNIAKTPYAPKAKTKSKNKSQSKTSKTAKKLFVTISIGVAERTGKIANATADEIIKAADKALYRAKEKGRNCVSK